MSLTRISLSLGGPIVFYVLYKAYGALYREFTSPIRHLPGISSANVIVGNMKEMMFMDQAAVHEHYTKQLGTTFKFRSLLWDNCLFTADVKAINHILKKDTTTWRRPMDVVWTLSQILGPGIVVADQDVHKRQRKILNPAFSPAEIRRFTGVFLEKAVKLRDNWTAQIQQTDNEIRRVDVLSWLGRATLDVIGETGFGYKFNSLDEGTTNELHEAFKVMFKVGTGASLIRALRGIFPVARYITAEGDLETAEAHKTMDRIGRQLLAEKLELALDPGKSEKGNNDILSLLVRANVSSAKHERLLDEQLLSQIPTFIIAGHETTSLATAWALFSLAQHPSLQPKLREELLAVGTENPSMDQLNTLPYLDAVVRETLRLHSPVPSIIRVSAEDDVIPLQNPIVDKTGKVLHEIKVAKGQTILISLNMVNRLEAIWGKDANEFDPDRWTSPPEEVMSVPGVWGNLLSFYGGPRACIGYRFSLIEMKALIFTLVRAFEFELAVSTEEIIKCSEFLTRPTLKTDPTNATQLPLYIRPFSC